LNIIRSIWLVALLAVAGCSTSLNVNLGAKKAGVEGVPHFAWVDHELGVARGGQPTAEGWKYLQSVGIKHVVKMNTEAEGSDAVAESLGMQVDRFPITTWQQLFGPVGPQLEEAAKAIGPGTFVHCTRGVNRTGSVVILHRVRNDLWQLPAAIAEAVSFGWESSFPALKNYCKVVRQ
jgi:hypothetical protein